MKNIITLITAGGPFPPPNDTTTLTDYYLARVAKEEAPGKSKLLGIPFSEEDLFARIKARYVLDVRQRGNRFFEDMELDGKIRRVAKWLLSPAQGLILRGDMGTGKSTLLRAIYRTFSCFSTFATAPELFDTYRSLLGGGRYMTEHMLFIDDVGTEPSRCVIYGEEHNPLARILLQRYDKCRYTLLASNLTFSEIGERYGCRVADRIRETFREIVFVGKSYRSGRRNPSPDGG